MEQRLILASASPRRRDLLKQIDLKFEVIPSDVEENILENDPVLLAKKLAHLKATDVAKREEGLVIGADTIVVDGEKVLGKPDSKEEAREMLQMLSGRQHQVITGVAVIDSTTGQEWLDAEVTQVFFRNLTTTEIKKYVDSGEPMDKAGAYAIQGKAAIFVEKIDGCFFNVVGLPLLRTVTLLQRAGMDLT